MSRRLLACLLPLLLLASGCASGGRSGGAAGADSPLAAVEALLDLANARDYRSMGRVFGTAQGPFAGQADPALAERQMHLFSCLLRHESREVVGEQAVPGSLGQAVRYDVRLHLVGWRQVVPFRAVQGPGGRWFVEDVRIELITNSGYPIPGDCRRTVRG